MNINYLLIALLSLYPITQQASQLPSSSTGNASSSQETSYPQLSFNDQPPVAHEPTSIGFYNRIFNLNIAIPVPIESNFDIKDHPEYCQEILTVFKNLTEKTSKNTDLVMQLIAKQIYLISLVNELEGTVNKVGCSVDSAFESSIIEHAKKNIQTNNRVIEMASKMLEQAAPQFSNVLILMVFKRPSQEELLSCSLTKNLIYLLSETEKLHDLLNTNIENTSEAECLLVTSQDALVQKQARLQQQRRETILSCLRILQQQMSQSSLSNEVIKSLAKEALDFTTEVETIDAAHFDKEFDNIQGRVSHLMTRIDEAYAIIQSEKK